MPDSLSDLTPDSTPGSTLLRRLRAFRGALFDLDGVLADSMRVWDPVCRDWLAGQGRKAEPGLEERIAPMTVEEAAEYVRRAYGIDLPPADIAGQWEGMVMDQYREGIALKEENAAIAGELYRAGLRLALVTSCFPSACEAFLDRHGIRRWFSALVYTGEAGGDKSQSGVWLDAARRIRVKPADCVVFEDSLHTLPGVRAAGMAFAAVYDPSCKDWEALRRGADFTVDL
ncbi:MAG: HAD family phosphatase [Treponema sp.]|jgi:16S rRNA pseudouridine516 synthase|nr:HAD family phosphatase [Treponema sp.]